MNNGRKFLIGAVIAFITTILVLGAYYIGKHDGASEAILYARPFIVEYVEEPSDYFTVYVDYQEYGVHEYTGFVG